MSRFAQGKFMPKNPEKYVGNKAPTYRSSWEFAFMRFCDTNDGIQKWASEAISIPYRCPITGRQTIYEKVGKNKHNQIEYARNMAKWRAAQAWCAAHQIKFRVLNEKDLFHQGGRR